MVVTGHIPRFAVPLLARLFLAISLGGLATACGGLSLNDEGDSDDIETEFRRDQLYVDYAAADDVDQERLGHALSVTSPPVYLMVDGGRYPPQEASGDEGPWKRLHGLKEEVGLPGTYVAYSQREEPGSRLIAISDDVDRAAIAELILDPAEDSDLTDRLIRFIGQVDQMNGDSAIAPPDPLLTWDEMRPWAVQSFGLLAFALLGYIMFRMRWKGRRDERLPLGVAPRPYPVPEGPYGADVPDAFPEYAETVRETNDREITLLGEALAALPVDLGDDARVRAHAKAALDCYERAKSDLDGTGAPETQNASAIDWLNSGAYHLTAINALRAGETPPDPSPNLRRQA